MATRTRTTIIISLCILITLNCCSCSGKVNTAKSKIVKSQIYSQEEITDAIEVVKECFKDFEWCKLTEIYYAGDKESKLEQKYYASNDSEDLIVVYSSFDVGWLYKIFYPGYPLGEFKHHTNYKWILLRKNGDPWNVIAQGYC